MIKNREEALRRKKENIRQAIRRYEKKFKRINCRLDPKLYEEILQTGMSVNSFICNAVAEKLERMKEDK